MADWTKIAQRGRVEDRRGLAPVIGGLGITGAALMVAFTILSGGDLSDVLYQLQDVPLQQAVVDPSQFEGEDEYEVFASTVLGSNNTMWLQKFDEQGRSYQAPTLVLFREATESSCGVATSQVGPHYCPLDETIYLDETFFDELETRLGAEGGDVAEAYVIAHEVAHHAQHELGIMDQVRQLEERDSNVANEVSVRLELQADCFAGMWANSLGDQGILEPGEIREAMDAAAAVGDDRIQERVTGQVNPETWTHGSSDQRVEWFNRGFESGSLAACNTF